MGNGCSCCWPDNGTDPKSPLPEGRSSRRYDKLVEDSTPETGRAVNGRRKPNPGGISQQQMRGIAKSDGTTLLEMAAVSPRDNGPAEGKLTPAEDATGSPPAELARLEDEPRPFADPSAISRRETIAPTEKPWLVENVSDADYKQEEDEGETDKNYYKEQSEHQKDNEASDWTRNRRRAIHRTGASPSSLKMRQGLRSDLTGANTSPVSSSGFSARNSSTERLNGAQALEPATGTEVSKIAGQADTVTSGAGSSMGTEMGPNNDPFSELSRRSQPALTSESPRNYSSPTASSAVRNSDPVLSDSAAMAVPYSNPNSKPTSQALPSSQVSPGNTDKARQMSAPLADSSSEQNAVTVPTDASRNDSGIRIKASSETTESPAELLPTGFTPPPRSRAWGVSRGSKLQADSSSLTGSTGSADSSGWVELSSEVQLSFGPNQLTSSRTTANCHIGDLLLCIYQEKNALLVRIQEGRNIYTKESHHTTGLSLSPQRWDTSSIYVKCYVESNGKHVKQKTSTVSASHSPKFNETLKFKPSWQNKQLRVMIWADHMLSRNIMLGEALIALSDVQFSKTETSWYSLFTADESISPSVSMSSLSSFAGPGALVRHESGRRSKRH